jgi:hypothetical protein
MILKLKKNYTYTNPDSNVRESGNTHKQTNRAYKMMERLKKNLKNNLFKDTIALLFIDL